MKVDSARLQLISTRWPDGLRLVLLYGQDDAASRDLADRIARQFVDSGNPMAVESLSGSQLASDPQALVAAAGAISMFGDRTLVRVDGIDEDGLDAVAALLASPAGNPVVAVAGALKKGSKLEALAVGSDAIAGFASYEPTLRDAGRIVGEIGAEFGLTMNRDTAAALFEAVGGDRILIRREIEKLSLYLDSDHDRQRSAELADVAALGAESRDADQFAIAAAVASGRPASLVDRLAQFAGGGGITALRAAERRLTLLLGLRGAVDGGLTPEAAVAAARPPIFWKEKDIITAELVLWSRPALVRALATLLAAERDIKASGSLGETLGDAILLTLARYAASRRSGA